MVRNGFFFISLHPTINLKIYQNIKPFRYAIQSNIQSNRFQQNRHPAAIGDYVFHNDIHNMPKCGIHNAAHFVNPRIAEQHRT